jgi:ferritin-like metal-binding protein YciE
MTRSLRPSTTTGSGMTRLDSIEEVYAGYLGALRSIETQLLDVLQELADAADDTKLSRAFGEQLDRTGRQLARLDEVIAGSPVEVPEQTSAPMRALVGEIRRVAGSDGPPEVRDVALAGAAQLIAHLEIGSYGTARALADQLDLRAAIDLLGESLEEEAQADELLSRIATGGLIVTGLNERAQG